MASVRSAKRLVVKIGSSLLVGRDNGALRADWLAGLAEDVAAARARGTDVIVVSSGSMRLAGPRLALLDPIFRWNKVRRPRR